MVVALAVLCLGHVLLLFNTGIYFDGWMLFDWLKTNNWNESLQFFQRVGMPLNHYWYWAAAHGATFPLSYKIFSFVWMLAGAAATYAIFEKLQVLSFEQRIFAILLAAMNPVMVTVIEPSHFCYHTGYFLIQLAALVFLYSEGAGGVPRHLSRAFALLLFLLSFNHNGLLTYYYGGWALWCGYRCSRGRWDYKTTLKYAFGRRLDFSLLPLVFWLWKAIFTPPYGDQLGHNSVAFGANMLPPLRKIPEVLSAQFQEVFLNLHHGTVLAACVFVAGVLLFIRSGKSDDDGGWKRTWPPLLSGAILFCGATFPYIASSRGFSIGLNGDRMNFLYSFPLALFMVGVSSALFPRGAWRIARSILGVMVFLFTLQTVKRYVNWQLRAVKDEAVMLAIEESGALEKATIFGVRDHISFKDRWDDRYAYILHQPTFMMAGMGGSMRWLGIPENLAESPRVHPPAEAAAFIDLYKLSYYARGVDLNGKQGTLHIQPGAAFNDSLRMFSDYCYFKFLQPSGFKPFLREVVVLTFSVPSTPSEGARSGKPRRGAAHG